LYLFSHNKLRFLFREVISRPSIGFILLVNMQSLPMGLALYGLRRPKRTNILPVPVLEPNNSGMRTKQCVDLTSIGFTSMGTVYDFYAATKKRTCSKIRNITFRCVQVKDRCIKRGETLISFISKTCIKAVYWLLLKKSFLNG